MAPSGALYLVGRSIYSQAAMMAYSDVFLLMALVYFFTVIPALLLRDRRPKSRTRPVLRPRPG
jgi:hypothetical protein